jgi:hypothetical protein
MKRGEFCKKHGHEIGNKKIRGGMIDEWFVGIPSGCSCSGGFMGDYGFRGLYYLQTVGYC